MILWTTFLKCDAKVDAKNAGDSLIFELIVSPNRPSLYSGQKSSDQSDVELFASTLQRP